ncbi:hypothetical protein [Niallia oryzisoli]|uniref:hypothetical protein n=1 Tax=Niallia oryzisoli TaxID=1737571 RepID=UPI003735480A
MPNDEKVTDVVDQPSMAKSRTDLGIEKETKNAKLASKPRVGETIIGNDGITGRIR